MGRFFAEGVGTFFLLLGIVGSAIMGEAFAAGIPGLSLLANAVTTGCVLFVMISILAPVSGAHFNPIVTMIFTLRGELTVPCALGYIIAQIIGAIAGVFLAHLIFDLPVLQTATTYRAGFGIWLSEAVVTFGLLLVIIGGVRSRPETVPALVAFYITGAYWFASSHGFANPAVTIARTLTDTPSGILPSHAPWFVLAQIIGLGFSVILFPWIFSANDDG